MKLERLTKLDNKNTATSKKKKKIDHEVMSRNCDDIAFFPIYGQLTAFQKRDLPRHSL